MNRLPTRRIGQTDGSVPPIQQVPEITITASPPNPNVTQAALAVGATAGLVAVALLGAPLWAGILVGAGGALVTKAVISNAA